MNTIPSNSGDSLQRSYQEVPYPGVSDPWSHIRCLEALGHLHGLRPADVTSCRVLELGCASGRNLLAQAAEFSNSHFIGIDFSADQIASGCEVVDALLLTNIHLRYGNIEDIDASWGQFDYILCPGVYSWVPSHTRQRILEVCRDNLTPQGVAAISYNAYPGWHARRTVRDLMRYHIAAFPDREQQIAEGRSVLGFVAGNCPPGSLQEQVFQREHGYLRAVGDDYLFHDYLAAVNCPRYFHEFVAEVAEHGLQFLCDADQTKMSAAFMSLAVQKVVANTPLVQRCQLLDYFRNESFHCSLLCHDALEVRYDRDPADVASYCGALIDRPAGADFAVPAGQAVRLKFPQGEIAVRPALGKAAMKLLVDRYPAAVDVDELCGWACAATGLTKDDQQVTSLASTMLAAFGAGLLRLYLHPPAFCREVGPRPRATELNRWWAAEGRMLTNALHENVVLEPWPCRVLSRLDGSLERTDLLDAVRPGAEQILGRPATAKDVASALDLLRRRLLLVG